MTSSAQAPDIVDFGSALTETALRERMYDRYQLDMSDLQVLVGRATDNWRMAHTKGSSHLQVLEKFTISVQLERRLTFTTDPQWPSATVAGNLPSLSIHINEKKVSIGFDVALYSLSFCDYVKSSCYQSKQLKSICNHDLIMTIPTQIIVSKCENQADQSI